MWSPTGEPIQSACSPERTAIGEHPSIQPSTVHIHSSIHVLEGHPDFREVLISQRDRFGTSALHTGAEKVAVRRWDFISATHRSRSPQTSNLRRGKRCPPVTPGAVRLPGSVRAKGPWLSQSALDFCPLTAGTHVTGDRNRLDKPGWSTPRGRGSGVHPANPVLGGVGPCRDADRTLRDWQWHRAIRVSQRRRRIGRVGYRRLRQYK